MAWTVEFSSGAERQLRKLDQDSARHLGLYLRKLVDVTTDPRERGKALTGSMAGLWRSRLGDFRLVCEFLGQFRGNIVQWDAVGRERIEARELAAAALDQDITGGVAALHVLGNRLAKVAVNAVMAATEISPFVPGEGF